MSKLPPLALCPLTLGLMALLVAGPALACVMTPSAPSRPPLAGTLLTTIRLSPSHPPEDCPPTSACPLYAITGDSAQWNDQSILQSLTFDPAPSFFFCPTTVSTEFPSLPISCPSLPELSQIQYPAPALLFSTNQ